MTSVIRAVLLVMLLSIPCSSFADLLSPMNVGMLCEYTSRDSASPPNEWNYTHEVLGTEVIGVQGEYSPKIVPFVVRV